MSPTTPPWTANEDYDKLEAQSDEDSRESDAVEINSNSRLLPYDGQYARQSHHFSWWLFLSVSLNIALLIIALRFHYMLLDLASPLPPWPSDVYLPASDAVEYETTTFRVNLRSDVQSKEQNIYMELTDEGDAAWEELTEEYATSSISATQASQLYFPTVASPPSSGKYLTGLTVFHQLHCLNRIRKLLHPERYPWQLAGNLSAEETNIHDNHCVDLVRQALMCNADISPISWQWDDRLDMALPSPETAHTCRKWSKIMEWAKENKA